MFSNTLEDRIKRLAKNNGVVIVKDKTKEECDELIKAIEKNDEENIIEELADVTIMVMQLVKSMGVAEKVDETMAKKVERTERRYYNT